ncbi:MAG: SLBB domain-containing protein [Chthonomonadales bacterium]
MRKTFAQLVAFVMISSTAFGQVGQTGQTGQTGQAGPGTGDKAAPIDGAKGKQVPGDAAQSGKKAGDPPAAPNGANPVGQNPGAPNQEIKDYSFDIPNQRTAPTQRNEQRITYFGYQFFARAREAIEGRRRAFASGYLGVTGTVSTGSDALTKTLSPNSPAAGTPTNTIVGNPLGQPTNLINPLTSIGAGKPPVVVIGQDKQPMVVPATPSQTPAVFPIPLPDPSVQQNPGTNQTSQSVQSIVNQVPSAEGAQKDFPSVDATKTFVGPDIMQFLNVLTPVPERYQLGPGDILELRIWSPTLEPENHSVKVDNLGGVILPAGDRVIVRGMTLGQAEETIRKRLIRKIVGVQITLSLKELRTIGVMITGESYAPGSYQMPSTTTFFNTLYASGGPTDNGTLRKILLKRNDGTTRKFDFYKFLIEGDASQDVPLQPGDVIFIPPAEARVTVKGEVNRSAIFELIGNETLRDAMKFAGGAKPTGISQRVSVESVQPGISRKLIDVSLLSNAKADNPILYSGDSVEVLSIRPTISNLVSIDGAVDQPNRYALYAGITVADLIDRARGLQEDAYMARADLFRTNPDNSFQLITIDLSKAVKRDPSQNVKLQVRDRLMIYSIRDVQFMGFRKVEVTGAVARPGTYTRADNMRVLDLLIQSGGTQPNAYLQQAYLQRKDNFDRLGPLVKLDIGKVLANDKNENVLLQDRDALTIFTAKEANFQSMQVVNIAGAVQKPMNYNRAQGMTVKDLIEVAGNILPTAYTQRAFLQRNNQDGTVGPLVLIDVNSALAGDPANNVPLKDHDTLNIYTREQAMSRPVPVVEVTGAVLAPGKFPRAENMKLSDLIQLAGGLKPDVSDRLEIAHSRTDIKAVPMSVGINSRSGNLDSNPMLEDGDIVVVHYRGDYLEKPTMIVVSGAVNRPGPIIIRGKNMRISDVIKDAGGLRPEAYPEGAEFTRSPQQLETAGQLQTSILISKLNDILSADEKKRLNAASDVEKIKAVTAATKGGSISVPGISPTPDTSNSNPAEAKGLEKLLAEDLVSPARKFTPEELTPLGNVSINLLNAIKRPGKAADDIFVAAGDTITIPERPSTVQVLGAVTQGRAVPFTDGANVEWYVNQSGGYTIDAAKDRIMIVRMGGGLIPANKVKGLWAGDIILVPSKVLAQRLGSGSGGQIDQIFRGITTSTLLILAVKKLIGI